jgi:protein required for attachment to host cells
MRIRIVSADQTAATFYDVEHLADGLRVARRLEHPAGHLHNRDLVSDRPGRKDDHAPLSGRRRGATAHHATGGERSPHKHEAQLFARQIAAELEHERADFDRLVLMAGPEMLGLLRDALSDGLRAQITAEVGKDLERQPPLAVLEHLPRAVFARPAYP